MAQRPKRLVIGNWKACITTPQAAVKLASALRRRARTFTGVDVVVAPPAAFVAPVAAALKGSTLRVAAQAVSPFEDEKRTGEVTAAMLKSAGATFAIIGHSERRAQGESDETVARQAELAVKEGLRVVLCVGERERDAAGGHFSFIAGQLREGLRHIKTAGDKLVVAYEPVWAIGKTAMDAMKPEEVEEAVIFIRKTLSEVLPAPTGASGPRATALKVPILYGGSVEPSNVAALVEGGGISGFLVGHASTQLDSFIPIIDACKR